MLVKGDNMRTAERRKALLEILCQRRHDTYENLADDLNVSRETIRNDIAALMCRYPIETVRGCGGGVRVADGFYLYRDSKSLTPKQYEVLKKLSAQMDGDDRDILDGILAKFAP